MCFHTSHRDTHRWEKTSPPAQFEHLGKTREPEDSLLALSALWLAPNNKVCFYRQNRGAEDGEM